MPLHPSARGLGPGAQLALLLVVIVGLASLGRAVPLAEGLAIARGWLEAAGPLQSASAAVTLYVLSELMFIPGSGMSLLIGALFGPWVGSLLVWLAANISAGVAFQLSRRLGRERMTRLLEGSDEAPSAADGAQWPEGAAGSGRLQRLDAAVAIWGWRWVAFLRIVPLIPYTYQNYLTGLTGISWRSFMIASAISMLPCVVLYVWAGHVGALAAERSLEEAAPALIGVAGLGLALLLVGLFARRRLSARRDVTDPGTT